MFTKKETDFCKGIAAILLLLHHLFYKPASYADYALRFWPISQDTLTYGARVGKLCVAMFVFFSGYGIAATYRKRFASRVPDGRELWNFTWRRCFKLMTGYWFIFVLTLLCQPLGRTVFDAYGSGKKDLLACSVIDFFGLADFFGTPTLNPTWWYMSLALMITFLMPLLMRLLQSFGPVLFPALAFLCIYLLGGRNTPVSYYIVMLLGAACFEFSVFERFASLGASRRYSPVLKTAGLLLVLYVLLKLRSDYNLYRMNDGLLTIAIALLVHTALIRIPVLTDVMQLIGRHSANIFLLHNQLYSMYFKDFYYSLGHWAFTLLALLLTSLLCSAAVEQLKRWTRYNTWMDRLGQKLTWRNLT